MLFRHCFLLLALLLFTGSIQAHPHVWIDLRVSPQVNEQGQITGLRQAWRFDPFYSLVLIEELEKGGPEDELDQRLDQLALEVVQNLENFDFFTQVTVAGKRQGFEPVTEYNLMQVGRRIEFSFVLPLQNPVTLQDERLQYQVYDPSYYIEILHAAGNELDTQQLPASCEVDVQEPSPPGDLVAKAMALDKDEKPEDPQLGEHFAETVNLDCRP
ncbi:DUF1007 family protein [Marinospirillum sp.]|uniref:DUF1007 family protein n=1 Tax=Marinospirillum sp. TaxID=2183934 RepID=UPI00384C8A1C